MVVVLAYQAIRAPRIIIAPRFDAMMGFTDESLLAVIVDRALIFTCVILTNATFVALLIFSTFNAFTLHTILMIAVVVR
jgi:hypothetical protein